MPIRLEALEGSDLGAKAAWDTGSRTVGRADDCDIVVRVKGVSRVHCTIERKKAGWAITDRGSSNGTWVNGRRIPDTAALTDGDIVTLGQYRLRVIIDESVTRPPIPRFNVVQGRDSRTVVGNRLTIGRVPENGIVLNEAGISRLHASITQEGRDFVLRDESSKNGTFLNGDRVVSSRLKEGDRIDFALGGLAEACSSILVSLEGGICRLGIEPPGDSADRTQYVAPPVSGAGQTGVIPPEEAAAVRAALLPTPPALPVVKPAAGARLTTSVPKPPAAELASLGGAGGGKAEAEPEPELKARPQPKAEPKAEPKPKPVAKPEPRPEVKAKPEPEPVAKPEPRPEVKGGAKPGGEGGTPARGTPAEAAPMTAALRRAEAIEKSQELSRVIKGLEKQKARYQGGRWVPTSDLLPNRARQAAVLVAPVLIALLAVGVLASGREAWFNPGPISSVHSGEAFLAAQGEGKGDDCRPCHAPGRGVRNEGCMTSGCHDGQAVPGAHSPAALNGKGLRPLACAGCHDEHEGAGLDGRPEPPPDLPHPPPLLAVDQKACTGCHEGAHTGKAVARETAGQVHLEVFYSSTWVHTLHGKKPPCASCHESETDRATGRVTRGCESCHGGANGQVAASRCLSCHSLHREGPLLLRREADRRAGLPGAAGSGGS